MRSGTSTRLRWQARRPATPGNAGKSARAQVAYGQPSAINRLLILNAEPYRSWVLLDFEHVTR
jgi:hypothetical protein